MAIYALIKLLLYFSKKNWNTPISDRKIHACWTVYNILRYATQVNMLLQFNIYGRSDIFNVRGKQRRRYTDIISKPAIKIFFSASSRAHHVQFKCEKKNNMAGELINYFTVICGWHVCENLRIKCKKKIQNMTTVQCPLFVCFYIMQFD